MRRIIFLAALLVLACAVNAYADASIFRGRENIGSVQTIDDSSGCFVSVEDVGILFGFKFSRAGDELVLTRGNSQLRVIMKSAAAWRGFSIVPLSSVPFERNGKVWIDTQSAASLFQAFAGSGQGNRLRFIKNAGVLAQKVTPNVDADKETPQVVARVPDPIVQSKPQQIIEQPKPQQIIEQPKPQQIIEQPKPQQIIEQPKPQQIIEQPKPQQIIEQPEPQKVVVSEVKPETPLFEDKPDPQLIALVAASNREDESDSPQVIGMTDPVQIIEKPEPLQFDDQTESQKTITPPARVKTKSEDQEVVLASSNPETPPAAKKQPRLETFRPGGKKKDNADSYSGTINKIRWTNSDGVHNKIMAVVETDDNADPQVFISGNEIHALFADCLDNAEGLSSPYDNVNVEVKKNSQGVELIFAPYDFTKAEKLVLNDPRRIAFDFFFPENVSIASDTSDDSEVPAVPVESSEPKIVQTPRQDQIILEVPEITTPRKLSPVVATPPSTITIPMTPGGVKRKTVVIDPGHGGKDPGASDNGILEKDINLAVGLAMERVLTARGCKVVMTRNTDVYLTLQERTDIANRENADLFVSVHVNALPQRKSLSGFEIYIMALPTDKDAMDLAKTENREYVEGKGIDVANVDRKTEMLLMILGDMQQNNKISESTDFAAALYNAGVINGLPMRRIAQAPFFVLRGAGMPAVLLEIGFVTNVAESAMLATPDYQQKIAVAMAAGIMNYLK